MTFARFKRDFARFKRGTLPDSNVGTWEAQYPPDLLYNGSRMISSLEMSAVFCAGFFPRDGFVREEGVDDIQTKRDKIVTLATWNDFSRDSPMLPGWKRAWQGSVESWQTKKKEPVADNSWLFLLRPG